MTITPARPLPLLLLLPVFHLCLHLCPPTEAHKEGPTGVCSPGLSLPLEPSGVRRLDNDSLLYRGLLYPRGFHWSSDSATYGCICDLLPRACVRKCCPPHQAFQVQRLRCLEPADSSSRLPALRLDGALLSPDLDSGDLSTRFRILQDQSCPGKRYILDPGRFDYDRFQLQANGSILLERMLIPPGSFCLEWREDLRSVIALVCSHVDPQPAQGHLATLVIPIGMILSIPFFLATFLVYAVIPELRNLYGRTLMCYVACLVAAYGFLTAANLLVFGETGCIVCAFIIHFSFLASFFWLNVMCFDIWWTFGGFRSLQGSVKQREKKKFLMYSIYAWGCATTLTVICAIMDYAPSVPDHFIKPGFGSDSCWFKSNVAKAIYFYGPMGVTVFCNICLFISTALKIVRHKKDTAHQLKGSESRRHDDNKQWFNLYLKLFIVMGINWSMEIISWLLNDTPGYLWYITDLMNTLQGLIIFIIFVWKDKIKRLLLRRFGCQGRNVLSRNSTRSACNSSSSRTCTTLAPLQEKSNPFVDSIQRPKPSYDESDGV